MQKIRGYTLWDDDHNKIIGWNRELPDDDHIKRLLKEWDTRTISALVGTHYTVSESEFEQL